MIEVVEAQMAEVKEQMASLPAAHLGGSSASSDAPIVNNPAPIAANNVPAQ